MYYKKRPELMKMVEEFYRAYRALAERYDHATGALRQAHKVITEAFPNQVPSGLTEDDLASFANENDPQTPDDQCTDDGKGLKQLNDSFGRGRVRKELIFDEVGEREDRSIQSTVNLEKEIQRLREALAKFEAEKFEKLQDSEKKKAEDEVESLKITLKELKVEKETSLVQYQKCLERINDMDAIVSCAQKNIFDFNERAQKAEAEAKSLKLDLATMESEKATSTDQYKQSLEKILALENKLVLVEEEAKKLNMRAEEAETEAETLKKALDESGKEKEANVVRNRQLLDTISDLEIKISCAEEEVQMLNGEIESGVAKLKGAEEKSILLEKSNQSLHFELESLKLRMGVQSEELVGKSREIGILWTSVQEERLRFVEAETAFQTLQLLHSQTEEEMKSLALELQNRSLIISDLRSHNQSLLNESLKIKEENKSLSELNLASSASIKNMQNEIISLWETKGKLEEKVELREDQSNALQQDIYCLKGELNDLNKKYLALLDQINAVGFNPECFQSAVKGLQDENLNLKEIQEREMREKVVLLGKIENLEKVVEKNALLKKSLSDLSTDLEGAREEILALQESLKSVSEEKSTLHFEKGAIVTQLQMATENLEKLSEKNSFMENSISDAHDEIEGLSVRLKSFEDSCQILESDKAILINEKVTLVSQVEITSQRLEDLEKKYRALEENYVVLGKENDSTLKGSKFIEEKQMIEIANLHGKVLDLQKTSVALEDEKISLVRDFLDLQEKNYTLEGETLLILGETAFFSNLSLIFKNIINEKSLEIEELGSTVNNLLVLSVEFEDKISVLQAKLEGTQLENMDLKKLLKKTEDNLSAVTLVNRQLNLEIDNGKDLLCQMETEICDTENEKSELQNIIADLKEKNDEIKMLWDEAIRERNYEVGFWELEATNLTSELHTSFAIRTLLEEKFPELIGVLKNLEDESNSKERDIELLKKRINTLDGENGEIGARLAEYAPAINSLKDCICSLENTTCLHKQLQDGNHEKVPVEPENHVESHEQSNANQKDTNNLSDLQDLERRIKAVERTVIEINTKLEAAMREIEELGSKATSNQENVKPLSVNSISEYGLSTKDIMLDQISDCSSYEIGGKDEKIIEKGVDFDTGVIVEKVLGEDELAIPNQELDKAKILERLNSDSQRLSNLQITVMDLKTKVEMSEYESVEGKLVKAEEDIMQLSDLNGKLKKNIENFDDAKEVVELEGNRDLRGKYLEQARKVSERIGQLQLNVQKIQFLILKTDRESGKNKTKRKSEITEMKKPTVLRDYLGLGTRNQKKKRAFCGCVRPPPTAD